MREQFSRCTAAVTPFNGFILTFLLAFDIVFDAFDVMPTGYFLKDGLTEQRLTAVLDKVFDAASKKAAKMFLCENGQTRLSIPLASILYFEVSNRVVSVHHENSVFTFYATLESVERKLACAEFVRVHRAYLVHLPYVRQLEADSLILSDGMRIPIGVTYAKRVKEAMNRYYSRV